MSWLALEAGDAATWGGTVVTFGMTCYAIAQGLGQRRDLRRQNQLQAEASQLQRRQIETAERRTLVMEQILSQLTAPAPPSPAARAWQPLAAAPPPYPPPGTQAPVQVPVRGEDVTTRDASDEAAADADLVEAEASSEAEEAGEDTGYDWLDSASDYELPPVHRARRPARRPEPPWPAPAYGQPTTAAPTTAAPSDARARGPASPPPQQQPVPYAGPPGTAAPPHSASPPPAPPGVWRLERFGQHGFALRNTSAGILTGVHISRSNLPASVRGVPEDSVVRPGETAEFLMAPERGQSVPDTILVSWHGQPVPVAVRVPRA